MQQEVGLARTVSPEMEVPTAAAVRLSAADLGADESLSQCAGER